MSTRKAANAVSGIIGFVAPTVFAWIVFLNGIPQNLATWLMVLMNNVLGLILVIRGGNNRPWMQAGWLASSLLVVSAIMLGDSPWRWGSVETGSFALCILALCIWLYKGVATALIPYACAMLISALPLMIDFWHQPQPQTAWFWSSTVVSCALAIYAAEVRDRAHVLIPSVALCMNIVLVLLVIA